MELITNYIVERINKILTSENSKIALIGFVGSLSPKQVSGDIDIFCILNENELRNKESSTRLETNLV